MSSSLHLPFWLCVDLVSPIVEAFGVRRQRADLEFAILGLERLKFRINIQDWVDALLALKSGLNK